MNKTFFNLFLAVMTVTSCQYAFAENIKTLHTKDVLLGTLAVGCQPKGLKITSKDDAWIAEMCGKFNPETNKREPSTSVVDINSEKLITTIRTPMGARTGAGRLPVRLFFQATA